VPWPSLCFGKINKFRVNYTPLPSKMLELHSPPLKDA